MKVTVFSVCAFLLACHPASALSISGSVGGAPSGVHTVNFNDLAVTLGLAASLNPIDPLSILTVTLSPDAKVVNGSQSGEYAAPFLSGSNGTGFGSPGQLNGVDTTNYLTSRKSGSGISTISLNFASPQLYMGLLWGSIDTYNTLKFYNGVTLIDTVTGSDVVASPSGDQGVNGTLYVNINTTSAYDCVDVISTEYAFEFDNLAYNSTPVPEAGSLAGIFSLTLAGLALARRRASN